MVKDVILLLKAVSHSVCFAVVGIEYPAVNVKVSPSVPLDVIGDPLILAVNPVGIVADNATEVTVPLPLPLVGVKVISDLFILT